MVMVILGKIKWMTHFSTSKGELFCCLFELFFYIREGISSLIYALNF